MGFNAVIRLKDSTLCVQPRRNIIDELMEGFGCHISYTHLQKCER